MNSTGSRKIEKLADREYRAAYVASQISVGVPFQIRALRKQHGWSQGKLAEEAGMMQPRISAIEKAGKGKLNIDTLERIAAAFDVALMVKFVPFSELAEWEEGFDPDAFRVDPFDNDRYLHANPKTGTDSESLLDRVVQATTTTINIKGGSPLDNLMCISEVSGSNQAEMVLRLPPGSESSYVFRGVANA